MKVVTTVITAVVLAASIACAAPAAAITPDEWGMDDGASVGTRTAGTPCLAMESHQWAEPAGGGRYALWCPPPAFVWVPVH